MPIYRGTTREEMERAGKALKKKEYVCVCGAVLKHDEYRRHQTKCPSRPNQEKR